VLSLHAIPAESVGLPYQAQTCSMVDETNTTLACLYFGSQAITIDDSPYIENVTISFWGGGGGGGVSIDELSDNIEESAPLTDFVSPGGGGSGAAIVNYPVRPGSVVEIQSQGVGGGGAHACQTGSGGGGTATCVLFEAGYGTGETSSCSVCAGPGEGGGDFIVGGGGAISVVMCPNIHVSALLLYGHDGSKGGGDYGSSGAWNPPCISVVGCFGQVGQNQIYGQTLLVGGGAGAYGQGGYGSVSGNPYSGAGGGGVGCVWQQYTSCPCPNSAAGGDGGLLIVYSLRLVSVFSFPLSFRPSR